VQRLIAAAAALDGRARATAADLWPLVYVVPTADEQAAARDLLAALLAAGDNGVLEAAALEATQGPAIRARRLAGAADELLTAAAAAPGDAAAGWRLRAEALLRDIDAGFAEAARPPELSDRRARLIEVLGPAAPPPPGSASAPASAKRSTSDLPPPS
jgi:MoxR-like ATPase